jgi:hypothetical protein
MSTRYNSPSQLSRSERWRTVGTVDDGWDNWHRDSCSGELQSVDIPRLTDQLSQLSQLSQWGIDPGQLKCGEENQ